MLVMFAICCFIGMISGVDSSMMSGIDATEGVPDNSSELIDYR